MNKKHWNTVYAGSGAISGKDVRWMIDHSYDEVVRGLTNKLKKELELL
jgi:predicted DNA-binding protein (MmcQ/YjbR family)